MHYVFICLAKDMIGLILTPTAPTATMAGGKNLPRRNFKYANWE